MEDLIGRRIGRLVVEAEASRSASGRRRFRCRCDCGAVKEINYHSLVRRKNPAQSCGCLHRETISAIRKTHGQTGTYLHRAWGQMIQRCHNPSNPGYRHYGARGIVVCDG